MIREKLREQYKNCLTRITVLENQLNHCSQESHDEIANELIKEKQNYRAIKSKIMKTFQTDNKPVV